MTVKTIVAIVRIQIPIEVEIEEHDLGKLERGIFSLSEAIGDVDLLAKAKVKVRDLTIDDVDFDWEHSQQSKVIPPCAAEGCESTADPRWFAHHPSGGTAMICDGHVGTPCKGTPCTCPVVRR